MKRRRKKLDTSKDTILLSVGVMCDFGFIIV